MDIAKQINTWRKKALEEVQAITRKKPRIVRAREYLEIDQSAMDDPAPWPEMQKIADQEIRKGNRKQKRDDLIIPRAVCNQVTFYKKAWKPTLEEFREEHPFDPHDDLTEPSHNQNRNCGACPKCLKN